MPWLSKVPMGSFDSDDRRVETALYEALQRTHYSGIFENCSENNKQGQKVNMRLSRQHTIQVQ